MCDEAAVSLGFDFGTSHVKAVFYGKNDENIFSVLACGSSSTLDVSTRNGTHGCCEQDPAAWMDAMHQAVRTALADDNGTISNRVACIGVSGQQHGMVTVDCAGDVVRPCMLWCDTQASEEAKELSEFSGRAIPPGYTAPKILWLRRHERVNYDRTAKFMLPHDYVNYRLSGGRVWVMEPSDCSGTGLFDPRARCFDSRTVEFIGPELAAKLPALHLRPDAAIGLVDAEVLARLLPSRTAVAPVSLSCGGGDNAMSALGAGASAAPGAGKSGKAILSLGTSGTLFGSSPEPVEDVQGTVAPFCDCVGMHLPLLCVQNCAAVPEEMRQWGGAREGGDDAPSVEEVSALAGQEAPGCDGLLLLPYLSSGGERTPNWPHACGVLYGLKMGHLRRPGLLYRAALEAVTLSLYHGYTRMQACGYPAPDYIGLVGGGASNPLWRQLIADVFQMPVSVVYSGVEGGRYCGYIGALGAAFQALAVALGEDVASFANRQCGELERAGALAEGAAPSDPRPELGPVYRALFERRVALEDLLAGAQGWA